MVSSSLPKPLALPLHTFVQLSFLPGVLALPCLPGSGREVQLLLRAIPDSPDPRRGLSLTPSSMSPSTGFVAGLEHLAPAV